MESQCWWIISSTHGGQKSLLYHWRAHDKTHYRRAWKLRTPRNWEHKSPFRGKYLIFQTGWKIKRVNPELHRLSSYSVTNPPEPLKKNSYSRYIMNGISHRFLWADFIQWEVFNYYWYMNKAPWSGHCNFYRCIGLYTKDWPYLCILKIDPIFVSHSHHGTDTIQNIGCATP